LICHYNDVNSVVYAGAMMRLVTVAEMRAIEKEGDAHGVSYAEMMERAGKGVARIVDSTYSRTKPCTQLHWSGTGIMAGKPGGAGKR